MSGAPRPRSAFANVAARVERAILGAGMSFVAWLMARRLRRHMRG